MTHYDNNIQPERLALLQDILRLIARTPALEAAAPSILNEILMITQASATFYLVFDEPHILYVNGLDENLIPSDEVMQDFVDDLSPDIHISNILPEALGEHYAGWLLVPVEYRDTKAAVFALLFKTQVGLSDDTTELLMALVDGLTIATHNEKSKAHHEKLMRNQHEFVRIVSHDLRSPLTSIKGFASMLEASEQDEKKLHFAQKILAGVSQMTSLVDNIQDAGRYDPETGFYEMERSPTDLIDMVQNIVKHHLLPAEKEALTLKVNVQDDIPIVNVDPNMIERSIINLVDNAIKYTPNGGNIEVGLKTEKGDLIITISDNGFGISKENMRQLFQRHFRIRRREHNRVKGSGLGLFIVRSVARHHDGDAFVESVEGEGTTFGIRIPLTGENLLGGGSAQA
jgi:signal transduction histidine kinase